MLVTSGDDDSACVWNIQSRSLFKEFRDSEHTVFCSEFTPGDGSNLLTTDANGDLRLWDLNHSKPIATVEEAHDLGVLCCEFASQFENDGLDKKFILATGGNDDSVKLWTVVIGLNTKILSRKRFHGDHSNAVMCLRFSQDGQFLATSGGDKLLCVYNTESGDLLHKLYPHERYIGSCAFSRSSAFLVSGSNDRSVVIFQFMERAFVSSVSSTSEDSQRLSVMANRQDALLVNNVKAHNSDINDAIFVNDKDLVTCSSDKQVKLWKSVMQENPSCKTISSRPYAVYSMDLCLNKLVVGGMDGQVNVWNTKDWSMESISAPKQAAIRACRVNESYILVAGDGDLAHLFNVHDLRFLQSFRGHEATIFFAALNHDSTHVVTGDNDGVLLAWKIGTEHTKPVHRIDDGHDLGITSGDCMPISDSNHSIIVTGGNDCLLKVWKLESKKKSNLIPMKTLIGHGGVIMSVRFNHSGKLLASTSGDKTCRIWDTLNWISLRVLEGHDRYVGCAAFSSPDDLLVTGSNDRSFNVWKLSGPLANDQSPEAPSAPSLTSLSYEEVLDKVGMSKLEAQQMIQGQRSFAIRNEEIPEEFICPITQDVMRNPVLCSDGFVYEKAAIGEWLISRKKTSPMTNLPMTSTQMVLQPDLLGRIRDFCSGEA